MASPIVGGKRRIVRAEMQKKGRQDELTALGKGKEVVKKPVKKAKKKSAY